MLRRSRRREPEPAPGPDLAGLDPRWRVAVEEAMAAQARVRSVADQCRPGPLKERLTTVAQQVDSGVAAAWQIAERAQAADRMVASLDLDQVHDRLKQARRRLTGARDAGADTEATEHEVRLLAEQHAALSQLANSVDDAGERLRLLDLRLDAAVARAAQLVLMPDAGDAVGDVERELASVVEELETLRAGFDAVRSLEP